MYSLIVDSSTKILYIALINDTCVCYEKYIEGKNDHAKNIVFCIDEALKTENIEVNQLSKIIVGYGPGSYTGVRMAVTVCKMMAVFQHVPLYTISTLELMASGSKGKVLATIDARRGNAFAAVYQDGTIVLQEGLYPMSKFEEESFDSHVKEDSFKVDPMVCIHQAKLVEEPHLLVPNYLRETEAERNLE